MAPLHRWLVAPFALAMIVTLPAAIKAETTVPPAYERIAVGKQIPAELFYAIALAESGKQINAMAARRPWPWTLNVAGEGRFYPTRWAAWRALDARLASGERRIDIGLMQVSWRYHREQLDNSWLALEPEHNLAVAADILKRCYERHGNWWASVGCYHAPNDRLRAHRYTERVRSAWQDVTGRR